MREVVDKSIKRKQVDREASVSDEESECTSKKAKKPRILDEGGRSVTPTPPSQLPQIIPSRDPRIKATESKKVLSVNQTCTNYYSVKDAFSRTFKRLQKGGINQILAAREGGQPSLADSDDPYEFENEEIDEQFEPNAPITMPTFINVPLEVVEWPGFSESAKKFTKQDYKSCAPIEYAQLDEDLIVACEKPVKRHLDGLLLALRPLCYQLVSKELLFTEKEPYDFVLSRFDKLFLDDAAVAVLYEWKLHWKLQPELVLNYNRQFKNQLTLLQIAMNKLSCAARNSAFWVIVQICGYMEHSRCPFAVLSTLNLTYFMRYRNHRLEVSPPVKCDVMDGRESASLVRSMLYFIDLCIREYIENPDFTKMITVVHPKTSDRSMGPSRFYSMQPVAKKGRGESSEVREYQGFYGNNRSIIVKIIDYVKKEDGMERALTEIDAYRKLIDLQGKHVPELLFCFDSYPFVFIGLTHIDGIVMDKYVGSVQDIREQIAQILELVNTRKVFLDVSSKNVMIDKFGKHSGCPYGVLSTFNTSYFMRYRDHRLEILPPVSCNAVEGHESADFVRTFLNMFIVRISNDKHIQK